MDLIIVAALATTSVACFLTFSLRILTWRAILRHHLIADVTFTVALFLLFQGTLTGTLVAALGGLMMSLLLTAGRFFQNLGR